MYLISKYQHIIKDCIAKYQRSITRGLFERDGSGRTGALPPHLTVENRDKYQVAFGNGILPAASDMEESPSRINARQYGIATGVNTRRSLLLRQRGKSRRKEKKSISYALAHHPAAYYQPALRIPLYRATPRAA